MSLAVGRRNNVNRKGQKQEQSHVVRNSFDSKVYDYELKKGVRFQIVYGANPSSFLGDKAA